jgi:hypothetical protein
MKNGVYWDVTQCGSCKNRRFGVTINDIPSSPILVTLMMKALVPPTRRFLLEPHDVTSQKTPFVRRHVMSCSPVSNGPLKSHALCHFVCCISQHLGA